MPPASAGWPRRKIARPFALAWWLWRGTTAASRARSRAARAPPLNRSTKTENVAAASGGALAVLGRLRRRLGDTDHRRTQQPVMQHIARLQHLDDGTGRHVGAFRLEDRLMEIVVEPLALRVDAPQPV